MVKKLDMKITDCKQWIDDIDEVTVTLPELSELAGKTVMLTGGTGLICSTIVDLLARFNEKSDDKIEIIVSGRNVEKIRDRFLRYTDYGWFKMTQYNALSDEALLENWVDFVIYGAGNAYPEKIVSEPVETVLGNINGINGFLDWARQGKIGRIVYISSSEVYGRNNGDKSLEIDAYGGIDLLNFRNSYAIGKSAAEMLCVSYAHEYNVDSVIIRPGHVYGPTASRNDNRVGSMWAYRAANGETIIMKSDGLQIRSYCYALDFATALLKIMLKGRSASAYNVSNPDSVISIKELAELYSEAGGVAVSIETPVESEKKGFNPMKNSSLNAEPILALGWKPIFDAKRGTKHTVEIIRRMISIQTEDIIR